MYQQGDYKASAKWYRIACKRELDDLDILLNEVLGNPSEHLHRQYIKSLYIHGNAFLITQYPFKFT